VGRGTAWSKGPSMESSSQLPAEIVLLTSQSYRQEVSAKDREMLTQQFD
jgi:hypothetical protein